MGTMNRVTYGLFSMKQGSNQAIPLNHQENIADQLNVRKYLPIILFQLLSCLICYITTQLKKYKFLRSNFENAV